MINNPSTPAMAQFHSDNEDHDDHDHDRDQDVNDHDDQQPNNTFNNFTLAMKRERPCK